MMGGGDAWLLMLIDLVEIPKGGEESSFEDLSLIVGQETDFNRDLEQTFLQFVRDLFVIHYPLAIFFRGSHDCRRIFLDRMHDFIDVPAIVIMMIHESEPLHDFVIVTEIASKRSVFGDAGEQNQMLGVGIPWVGLLINGFQRLVINGREKQCLASSLFIDSRARLGIEISDA